MVSPVTENKSLFLKSGHFQFGAAYEDKILRVSLSILKEGSTWKLEGKVILSFHHQESTHHIAPFSMKQGEVRQISACESIFEKAGEKTENCAKTIPLVNFGSLANQCFLSIKAYHNGIDVSSDYLFPLPNENKSDIP